VSKIFAPVLITTLDRYEHLIRCISSLQLCKYSSETHLFVALDYPPSEEYMDGHSKIKKFLIGIDGFKEVTIVERTKNLGAMENFRKARELIFESYDKLIVSEDDNEFSVDFLFFLNHGLDTYQDNKKVFSICGYVYPYNFNFYKADVFAHDGFSAWGYATWKDRFEKVKWDIGNLEVFLKDKDNLKKIKRKSLLKHLRMIVLEEEELGDAYLSYYQIKNNMFSIFPVVSRVRNHGFDGSGINCGNDVAAQKIYSFQKIHTGPLGQIHLPKDIKIDRGLNNYIDKKLNQNRLFFYFMRPALFFSKAAKYLFKK
jgi:hypothetical protein